MATSTASRPLSSDPLRSFKFNVNIPISLTNVPGGVHMARLGFMTVAGLGIAIEPLTYREGGDNITTRKMPGQADINPITLSRGLFPTDPDNFAWMQILFTSLYGGAGQIAGAATLNGSSDFRTVMYINVLQHPNNTSVAASSGPNAQWTYPAQDNIIQVSYKLYSAWIGSIAYSDFDAGGNAVAVEQMTINYEGFDMQFGGNGNILGPVNQW